PPARTAFITAARNSAAKIGQSSRIGRGRSGSRAPALSPPERGTVSTSAVTSPAPSRLTAASSAARSLPSRAIAFFSGPVGLRVKVTLLALMNALSVWALVVLVDHKKWPAVAVLVAVTALLDLIYLSARRAIPAKFLVPGTVFLVAFQIIPVIYTVQVAFTNYSTG